MKKIIALFMLSLIACAVEPATTKVESNLCTIQDQLRDPGDPLWCPGPFALLPDYTRDYAHANTSAPAEDIDNNSIACGVIGGSKVMCVLDLDFPGRMTVVCTKEGNDQPVCNTNTNPDGNGCGAPPLDPCVPPFAPTGGKGTNFCTIQDQINEICSGPYSLLINYTRGYAAQEGYSSQSESSRSE